jgi:hypothetical protein
MWNVNRAGRNYFLIMSQELLSVAECLSGRVVDDDDVATSTDKSNIRMPVISGIYF